MARVAERLGVEICLNEPVEEILFTGKRAVGVRTPSRTSRKRMHTRTPGQSQHSGMVSGMVSVMVNVVLGRASVAAHAKWVQG